ncbi:MAG: DUF2279 domain-containing protein [Bacteroidales bacterium]
MPSDTINRKKLTGVILSESLLYGGSLIGLNELWYKDYPRSSFHFFNDNQEWLQMDKAGHFISSYHLSLLSHDIYRWTGMNNKKAALWGSITGFSYLTVIEILDGFSENWGASTGDILANTMGTSLFLAQQLAWQKQKVQVKWSFHLSDYAHKRPEALGKSLPERMLKDYNGQSIWLSFNPNDLIAADFFPHWLNLSFGYSANGMVGGKSNPPAFQHIPRYRQYLFSLDLNLRKIPTQSKTLKFAFKTLSFIKIPFPAIEFSERGWKAYPLYW